MKLSRGFVAALGGIVMTVLAWFGRWEWPSWPVFIAMDLMFGSSDPFADMTPLIRNLTVVFFFALNIAAWGLIVWLLLFAWRKVASRAIR